MLEYKLNDSIQPKHRQDIPFSLTKRGKAIDARLQTTVSVGFVYSIISVHKFEDLIGKNDKQHIDDRMYQVRQTTW
jgi:hypothetical protein